MYLKKVLKMNRIVKRVLVFTLACMMAWVPSIKPPNQVSAATGDANIDFSKTQQIIRGYGAASVWCGALSDAYMNKLYSDIGLSILRVRIAPNEGWNSGNYSAWADELSNAKKAKARGAIVFATPWTPPASMKTNNSLIGGQLKEASYWNYANYLKSFADYFANNGASLYAISIQNEPDWVPSDYEGCGWSATQFLNFIKYYASPVVGATKVIMPESLNFNQSMSNATLNDSTAASRVSIIGGHLYGATIQDYPLARSKGKELWMTEHLLNDQTIGGCMTTAKEIHDCMTVANMNAYVWWWIISDANGLYNKAGQIQKRAYVLGQFAKYIRPGYYRVNATYNPQTNVFVSAYKGNGKAVIVAINMGTAGVSQNFVIGGGSVGTMTRTVTSATQNMETATSLNASSGSFWAWLPAQSVTTMVGNIN